jgi:hypothetical protein
VSKALIEEFIRGQRFDEIMNRVDGLKTQKPEFIKQFYEQAK